MKKTTLEAIYATLNSMDYDQDILTELNAEINKDKARKEANIASYNAIKDIVMDTLSDTPVTLSEIYDSIKADLPAEMTKGKVQYAITHLWKDEIAKVEGKPNGYVKA